VFGRKGKERDARAARLEAALDVHGELHIRLDRRLDALEARPLLPVEDVRELREAVAGKINAATRAHAHPDFGEPGEPVKVSED
jgi:hypothetical protein